MIELDLLVALDGLENPPRVFQRRWVEGRTAGCEIRLILRPEHRESAASQPIENDFPHPEDTFALLRIVRQYRDQLLAMPEELLLQFCRALEIGALFGQEMTAICILQAPRDRSPRRCSNGSLRWCALAARLGSDCAQ